MIFDTKMIRNILIFFFLKQPAVSAAVSPGQSLLFVSAGV